MRHPHALRTVPRPLGSSGSSGVHHRSYKCLSRATSDIYIYTFCLTEQLYLPEAIISLIQLPFPESARQRPVHVATFTCLMSVYASLYQDKLDQRTYASVMQHSVWSRVTFKVSCATPATSVVGKYGQERVIQLYQNL